MRSPLLEGLLGKGAQKTPFYVELLRVGGVAQPFADHLLVLGEAAGQCDPLTGESVELEMDAAEIAVETMLEGFAKRDLSQSFLEAYQRSCDKRFLWNARM